MSYAFVIQGTEKLHPINFETARPVVKEWHGK